ncbi:MAG: amino acid permease [Myxococcales bacterium]|nr:amino acid permease [Myxococcales bacterium]
MTPFEPAAIRTAAASPARDAPAPRGLSRWGALAFVMGSMVGGGIFLTPDSVAGAVGRGGLYFSLWGLGAVTALLGALSLAELGAMFPRVGGEYVYLREAYGDFPAFLYGWLSLVGSFSGAIAMLCLTAATTLVPAGRVPGGAKVAALAFVWGLTALACLRIAVAARAQLALTGGLMAILLGGALWALLAGAPDVPVAVAARIDRGEPLAVLTAFTGIFFAYSGWNGATYVAGELERPQRDLPWALVAGTGLVAGLYLALNAAFVLLAPRLGSGAAGYLLIDDLRLPVAGLVPVLRALTGLCMVGAALAAIVTGARIVQAMAHDGLFVRAVAPVDPRLGTPVRALVVQAAWSSVLVVAADSFGTLMLLSSSAMMLLSMGTVAAVPWLRWRRPELARPFALPGYPWTALAYLTVTAAVLVALAIEDVQSLAYGLGTVAAGWCVFALRARIVARAAHLAGTAVLVTAAVLVASPAEATAGTPLRAPAIALAAVPTPTAMPMLRWVDRPAGHEHLDTPVIRMRGPNGVQLELVGALHIADRAYYRALQQRFASYDRLLYEMVKPPELDMARARGPADASALSGLQRMLKDALALEFQLDAIDYGRANFVHADVDPERLGALLLEHAGAMVGALVRFAILDASRTVYADGTPRLGGLGLIGALLAGGTAPQRARELKRALARELAEMDGGMAELGGFAGLAGLGPALIGERNQVAVDVLKQVLAAGGVRKVGIFYGAAHLGDLERRVRGLGFVRVGAQWMAAWRLGAGAR